MINTYALYKRTEKKETYKKTIFWGYIAAMLLLLIARNVWNIGIPVIFLLALTAIPIFLGDTNHILAVAVCCLPFATGFQYKYAFFLCIISLLWRNRFRFKRSIIWFIVLLLMFWELLHGFYPPFSFYEYLRNFAEFLLIAVVAQNIDQKNLDHKFIFRAYSVAVIGVCFIIFYLQLAMHGFSFGAMFSSDSFIRLGDDNTSYSNYGLNFNANGLGFVCNLAVAASLFLINRRESSLFDIITMTLAAIFAMMTVSRTAILCLLLLIFGFIFFSPLKGNQKVKYIFRTVLLLLALFLALRFLIPGVFDSIVARFGYDDVTNGRDQLFVFYNEHLFSSPLHFLFGIGQQSIQTKMIALYGSEYFGVCHSGFQEAMVCWGVLGLVLVFLLIGAIIYQTKSETKRPLSTFIPLISWALYVASGQLVTSHTALISLIFLIIFFSVRPKSDEKENEP